jgi:hypothetical protein
VREGFIAAAPFPPTSAAGKSSCSAIGNCDASVDLDLFLIEIDPHFGLGKFGSSPQTGNLDDDAAAGGEERRGNSRRTITLPTTQR